MSTALIETTRPIAIRPETWAGAAARGVEARREREAIVQQVLIPGVDTKPIPGCGDKPVLHDCGAQKIMDSLNLYPEYEALREVEDWDKRFWFYRYRCTLKSRNTDAIVSTGIGSCNSKESKYGYQWLPRHQVPPGIDASSLLTRGGRISEFQFAIEKAETSGQYGKPKEYWDRWKQAILDRTASPIQRETKTKKKMDAWEMDDTMYRVVSDRIEDTINTLDKMAQKRARVAAVIALGFGEWLTQDIEDSPESFGGVPAYAQEKPAQEKTVEEGENGSDPTTQAAQSTKSSRPAASQNGGSKKTITREQHKELSNAVLSTCTTQEKQDKFRAEFLAHFGIKQVQELPASKFEDALVAAKTGVIMDLVAQVKRQLAEASGQDDAGFHESVNAVKKLVEKWRKQTPGDVVEDALFAIEEAVKERKGGSSTVGSVLLGRVHVATSREALKKLQDEYYAAKPNMNEADASAVEDAIDERWKQVK